MTTLLHVEADEPLARAVRETFEAFGFRGTCLAAHSVREARRLLAEAAGPTIDLILSCMKLPDGTGLDIVRTVRTNPARATVPIVILSANTDARTVDQAYVLGANAYIGKSERGRSLRETLRALWDHWLKDVRLPPQPTGTRTQQLFARASGIRSQKAASYLQIAERLGADDGALWMDLALRSGNLANLYAFLVGQIDGRELPADILDEAEAAQAVQLRAIADIARKPVRTLAETERYELAVIANVRVDIFDRALALAFPDPTAVTTALRNVISTTLDEIASWIELHATDAELRDAVPRLRKEAADIRAASYEEGAPAETMHDAHP